VHLSVPVGTEPNQTQDATTHFLACSSVTYSGRNAAHVHLPFDVVTYKINQTLELTVMSIICSIVIL